MRAGRTIRKSRRLVCVEPSGRAGPGPDNRIITMIIIIIIMIIT